MDFLSREDYLELNEVCEHLSITKATAYNWIKNNTLKPAVKKGNKYFFLQGEIDALSVELKEGQNGRLKSRRNKSHVSGAFIPKTYIQNKEGIEVAGKILSSVNTLDVAAGYERVILAEYALKLLASRKIISMESEDFNYETDQDSVSLLTHYLEDPGFVGRYAVLIDDILSDVCELHSQVLQLLPALRFSVDYMEEQDFLGLLYMSLQNLGERKAKGVYYTPLTVVKDAVDWLKPLLHEEMKLLDPCCGTGNFLMYAYKYVKSLEGLHGYDISCLSVSLTRINMALVTKTENIELLYRNFLCINPLLDQIETKFDVVVGNPPWGFNYSNAEQKKLKKTYAAAQAKTVESFSVFAEFALKTVVERGTVCLILPQSLLQVKIHQPIRSFLMKNSRIKRIRYWDNAFDGVQCPAMTLIYEKTSEGFCLKGTEVVSERRAFTIAKERAMDINNWSFDLTDEEISLLTRLQSAVPMTYLKDKADFALGIVTGDNKKFLSYKKVDNDVVGSENSLDINIQDRDFFEEIVDSEPIYRGSDVYKFKCLNPLLKIKFNPLLLQQVAPTELYRAKEKLIYRFIGGVLVFAYDDTQSLTLNSANIVIPKVEGLNIKYVLAVLNSRIAQYYYSRQFKSLKILRSQIESIPIPIVSKEQQDQIIEKVDCIIRSSDQKEIVELYDVIDDQIRQLFGLPDFEYELIKKELVSSNLFLSGKQ